MTTVDVPYAAWRRLEDLPAHGSDAKERRDLFYGECVGGHPLTLPLRAAVTFLETLGLT